MGKQSCQGDHEYVIKDLDVGVARLECEKCDSVVIDLDEAEKGEAKVTVPGLFGPAKPTIFSVLGAEQKAEAVATEESLEVGPRRGPRFAFQGGSIRR